MLVAMSKFVLTTGRSAMRVPVYIASGIFGKAAFTDSGMAVWGLLLHYIIALLFTSFYFWLAHRWAWLIKHWGISGVVYGLGSMGCHELAGGSSVASTQSAFGARLMPAWKHLF
jgi:hypothetical protein